MELTDQQKKDLKKFSLLLNAMNMEDGNFIYEYPCYDSSWDSLEGPTYDHRSVDIDTPKSITDLFADIRDDFDTSNFYDDYNDNETGVLYFDINVERKIINVTYTYYVMNTERSSIKRLFKDLLTTPIPWDQPRSREKFEVLNNPEFIKEMYEKYGKDLIVTYDGGGDSGWVNDDVQSSTGNEEMDGRIEDIVYAILESYYSGWEINEGSNGNIQFNFETKEIHISHTLNYEESQDEEYMVINF
jgi:hypothetical protein